MITWSQSLNKEQILEESKKLKAPQLEWLISKLNDVLIGDVHDGMLGVIYQDIRKTIGINYGEERVSNLTPWMSLNKTKKAMFEDAVKQAKIELKKLGVTKEQSMMCLLVPLYPPLSQSISMENLILALKNISYLFDSQFPGYDFAAISKLNETGLVISGSANPLYDEEDD